MLPEIRRMVLSAAAVLLLAGVATGVFLEKLRREAVEERQAAVQEFRDLLRRFEAASASFGRLETDNGLLAQQNARLRAAAEEALKETTGSLDRMKALSAQLAVYSAVVRKSLETVQAPADLKDAPAAVDKMAELERRLELNRKAALYFAKYAELTAAGRKADPNERQATLETALNALGVTEAQYQGLEKTP